MADNRANKLISGYWENWKGAINPGSGGTSDPSYYMNDIADTNHVLYSFLTLDETPNPYSPNKKCWNGKAIYESMSGGDVLTVMTKTDPAWQNQYEWQRVKIDALIQATHEIGGKFVWAIGGWSDLTKTIQDKQSCNN